MEIVTGDRYLDMLAHFVEENVAGLLDGSTVLKLNPVGLHYLQARLDSLQELERLRAAAPVDYLRAYIADLGDHRALELLRRVLRLLGTVKVVSVLQAPARDPTPITLLPFEHLRSLELRGCDLSTSAAKGLLLLRPRLEKLICHNSTDALRHVFAERVVEIRDSQGWSRLTSVSCACNGIPVMDESLQLLPVVEVLDLRRNRLTHVLNLEKCSRLKFLDLGFNCIQSVAGLDQVASSLTTLVLKFNALNNTRGIENLPLLRFLDLSHNKISSFKELERIGGLHFLCILNLEGNPVTFSPNYREQTFSVFPDPAKLCLDGKHLSRIEHWKVKKLIQRRCNQDGGIGLYAPAIKSFIEGGKELVSKAKKKSPRLVAIAEDGGVSGHVVLVDQALDPSGPSDDVSSIHDIEPVEAVEARLQQLIKRIEELKEDNSTLWLTEISRLLENSAELSQEKSVHVARSYSKSKQSRRKKRQEELASQTGSTAKEAKEDVTATEVSSASQILNDLVVKPLLASSFTSPPEFNREVLQRRQNLEEELMRLRISPGEVSDSDSSTSGEIEVITQPVVEVPDNTTGTSDPFLGEEGSCFASPMWVGSTLKVKKDKADKGDDEPGEEASDSSISRSKVSKRSSQAWEIVPVESDEALSDSRSVTSSEEN